MSTEEIVLGEPLLSELIPEEKLNNLIVNSVDIDILNAALNLKLFLLKTKKQSALIFSIKNIIQMDFKKHEDRFLQAVKSGLLLQQSNEEYKVFLQFIDGYINKNYSENGDSYLIILQLIQVALEVATLMKFEDLFFDDKLVIDIIIKAVDWKDKIIFEFLSFKLLPLYLSTCTVQYKKYILQKIFETENVNAMCALSDFFLPSDLNCVFTLIHYERFWYIIQACINSDSRQEQKQGLFLLKRAINIMFNNWCNTLLILPSIAKLHTQDKNEAEKMWSNYITLLEVIREEHFYLIEPLFSLLHSLHVFDHTWVICIYNILLSHPNYLVVHTAFQYYLKYLVSDVQTFHNVVKLIIPHLNKCTNLKLLRNTYSNLKTYLSGASESFTIIFSKEGTSINWSPLTLWYYYKCNLFQQNVQLPYDIIENYFVLTLSLPHKYIRKACLSVLVNYVVDILQHKIYSFKDRLKIFNLFSKQNETTTRWDKIIEESESLEFISHISKSCTFSVCNNIQDFENAIKLAIYYKINLYSLKTYLQSVDYINFIDVRLLDSVYFKCFNCYEKDVDFLYNYIIYRLQNLHHDDIIDEYVALINAFVSHTLNNELCLRLERKAMQFLLDESGVYTDVQKQAAFNIVIVYNNTTDIQLVCDKWKNYFLFGNMEVSQKTCSCFLNVYVLSKFNSDDILTHDIINEACNVFFKVIETQHHEVLPVLFKKLLPQLLINVNNTEVLEDILMKCSQAIMQTSKCGTFKDILNSFIESIFVNDVLLLNNTLFEIVSKIFYLLHDLSKTHTFIALKLVYELKSVFNKKQICYSKFSLIITNFILLQKNVCTNSERSEYEVCQEIYQHLSLKDNPNSCHLQIHFGLLEVLQIIIGNEDNTKRTQFMDDLTRNLLEKYFSNFYKKRYFPNSEIHFFKQRIMQVLLFLQPHMSLKIQKEVIQLIIDSFRYENHQPSVRQLMQWLLIRLITDGDDENGIKAIIDLIDADINIKNKLFIVLAPVIYHVATNASESLLLTIFKTFLPITMGAQFKSRLYAQLILHHLYGTAIKKRYLEVTNGYQFLDVTLNSIFSSSRDKIDETLQSDKEFLFDFDPLKHYSLETIYVDIPKLNNVTSMNWENFHHLKITEYPIIKVFNSCRALSLEISSNRNSEYYQDINEINIHNCNNSIGNIQKKINTFDIFEENFTKTVANDFVLIGSLIEKTANLGGLSRSCEVFGIDSFVINNIKILEDPEFKSLSMTSQKWINILEVKTNDLKNFLLKQKEVGFEIVAAEQTTSSISLGKYTFKKKTVLLLGNEKEGIPADLLLIADVCIEIPQQGVIRSLNVHVAGALLMWEYHKQNHCSNM